MPADNRLEIFLFIEVLGGKNFEHNNVYLQYFLDLPEPWRCKNPEELQGCTPSSVGNNNILYFGLPIDVRLEYNMENLKESCM